MQQKLFEKIKVITSYSPDKNIFIPYKIRWRLRDYFIKTLAYHHKVREGRELLHIFHVTDGNLDFRIRFNTEDLNWILEEVSDGNIS